MNDQENPGKRQSPGLARETAAGDSLNEFVAQLERSGIEMVRCQFIDLSGVARGRAVYREYLPVALRKGLPFAQVNNAVDIDDDETDLALGSQAGDMWALPDPDSYAPLPYASSTGHLFTNLRAPDGTSWPSCTRTALQRLQRVVEEEIGTIGLGFEPEGYIARNVDGRYEPVHRGKQFTAEILDAEDDFLSDLTRVLLAMGIPLEKITAEGGWGMFEVNFAAAAPLEAAERYFRFKHAFRAVARKHGYVGTFMPKPFPGKTGAGLHVHIGCTDAANSDLFATAGRKGSGLLSESGRHFLGGLLRHAGSIAALGSPSVNSYKRLQPGTWAPSHVAYGVGNRSALVRVVPPRDGVSGACRLELRSPDGTCNPQLLGAAILAAGLDGVRRRIDPGPAVQEDIARLSESDRRAKGIEPLPSSLDRALDALEQDATLHDLLGETLVESFLKAKRIEWAKFAAHVTDWEYRYYAEFF